MLQQLLHTSGTFILFCSSEVWKKKKKKKKVVVERKWGFFFMESIASPSEKPTIQPFWNLVGENQVFLAKATQK